ncbi:hypothetical protein [Corynebacterium efficiens YS-314]|uniref:Uncharacterized protein n=1 Tax=Corynebacterium efficiens (strain DSM 44549 / YS-314 / AJ 12310 / JCM 11189 / NBRC 100395) TaxID=196164 RepID=Q8FQV4_COREF|nr:hypothetical protein [Corynebacterium efficiens YS-314]
MITAVIDAIQTSTEAARVGMIPAGRLPRLRRLDQDTRVGRGLYCFRGRVDPDHPIQGETHG